MTISPGAAPPPAGAPEPPVDRSVRHRPWPTAERVVVAETAGQTSGLVVTNRSLLRDGRRWLPVSGEIHFSRLDRRLWQPALELLRAGGVDLVSTYVFWNHHQPLADQEPDFTGNRDLAAFLRLCAAQGLPAIVRIGPWCHGEVRHGGHPDWLVARHDALRTDSAGYLADVERYFRSLGRELGPLCAPAGPVVAVQIENELYGDPQHIRTLKAVAKAAGIEPALWTATGWGNAQLPVPEVFPVYSGYSEGFWVDAHEDWDDSFRSHFFFCDRWDDPGVGKDLAGAGWSDVPGSKHPDLPPATCELGGGMAVAYHRRPVPSALDVAAVGHVKIGSGSVWQGYYMYVGGTNPEAPDGLQESHHTGYPNDTPRLNYDFHAPIGRDMRVRESFRRLALQHSFLEAFGSRLAGMVTTFPDQNGSPEIAGDRRLRWCLRSDGVEGFVFVNNHQAVEPLPAVPGVRFAVCLDDGVPVLFPPRGVEVPTGALWCLPVGLAVGAFRIRWATATVLTELAADDGTPILFMYAHPGLPAQMSVGNGSPAECDDPQSVIDLEPGGAVTTVTAPTGQRLHVVVLDSDQSLRVWTPTVSGRRQVVLSDAEIVVRDGALLAFPEASGTVELFDTGTLGWRRQDLSAGPPCAPVDVRLVHAASERSPIRRSFNGRASAPTRAEVGEHGACYRLTVPSVPADAERVVLRVDLVGDVAHVNLPGAEPFDDLFWSGEPWTIDLGGFRGRDEVVLELHVTPVRLDPAVRLTPRAQRLARRWGPVAAIHHAEVLAGKPVDITGLARGAAG
ncbi:beta-galactosidase [Catellatospora sp. KI3]|uniref:beta-galactosidase n=1 Tax=Catellatospora sp. KI3 TaxID=3041620 RepID=UPI002482A1C2|nr:beta-galactosidase [Catellatospora sp. KI3]MDI1460834.1 beta-galactosidase [Catellatospora sp. KI3]